MSKKLPEASQSEEVDLGQLFTYFERFFKKIGDLFMQLFGIVKWIVLKVSILLLLALTTLKKNFLIVTGVGLITFAIFYFLDMRSEPIYQSRMIMQQNYRTGKLLYSSIRNYNELASIRDSVGLGKELGIPSTKAARILGFQISDYMNINELLESYNEYVNSVDSTLRITFDVYSGRQDLENYPLQAIEVTSSDASSFEGLSSQIISSLEGNKFFKEEREREMNFIASKIKAQEEIVQRSDTLQEQYFKLLEQYYGAEDDDKSSETTLNINMSSNKDKIETKEFALFEKQNILKLSLIDLKDRLEKKTKIARIQKEFAPPKILASTYQENKLLYTFLAMGIALLYFLIKELGVFNMIEHYGSKEKLLE